MRTPAQSQDSKTPRLIPAADQTSRRGSTATTDFVDHRRETIAQRERVDSINRSPKQVGQHTVIDALHKSPQMLVQQRQLHSSFGNVVQQSMDENKLHMQTETHVLEPQKAEAQDVEEGPCKPVQTKVEPNRTGLPDQLKTGIESLSGLDLSSVRVHYNSAKPAQLRAHAYTQGTEIHVAAGQEQHVPHEAWHVVQQMQGRVSPTLDVKGVSINDNERLEREADENGTKALQRKRTGQDSKAEAGTSSVQEVIQRRIGFEIETGIPITERRVNPDPATIAAHPHIYHDAHPQTMAQNVRQGTMVISADHTAAHVQTVLEPFAQWSIIEAVTDPIDDSMSINTFDAIAKAWLSRLITIKKLAQTAPPAKQLLGSAYYVGLPSAQAYNDWDRIAPQVTVGVPLDQVGKIISAFPLSGTASAFNATQLAKDAPAKALSVIQQLVVAITPATSSGVKELKGLITLMMNYLTAGNDDQIAKVVYMKNRPANVFYKSKLSDVRNNLLNTWYGEQVLNSDQGRDELRNLLLSVSGRNAGTPLFKADPSPDNPQGVASNVTVGTWISEVLNGTDDRIFDEMKNPWANKINPDANDEVVIELRKQGFDLTHSNFTLEDFGSGLLAYMKKVYLANKAIKNHED